MEQEDLGYNLSPLFLILSLVYVDSSLISTDTEVLKKIQLSLLSGMDLNYKMISTLTAHICIYTMHIYGTCQRRLL